MSRDILNNTKLVEWLDQKRQAYPVSLKFLESNRQGVAVIKWYVVINKGSHQYNPLKTIQHSFFIYQNLSQIEFIYNQLLKQFLSSSYAIIKSLLQYNPRMVKRDPDDLITAASKNLKKQNTKTMRITLKRGGQHLKLFSKAHSRIALRDLKKNIRQKANENANQVYPLYVRYKEGVQGKQTKQNRHERTRLNCEIKLNKANDFISSLLGVFRVNFFKKKEEQNKGVKALPSKADPNSKTSLKKLSKNKRNKQRRTKRKQLSKAKQQQQKKAKLIQKQLKEPKTEILAH